jgi:hypothetical protein
MSGKRRRNEREANREALAQRARLDALASPSTFTPYVAPAATDGFGRVNTSFAEADPCEVRGSPSRPSAYLAMTVDRAASEGTKK